MKLPLQSCALSALAISAVFTGTVVMAADEPLRKMVSAPASSPQYSQSYSGKVVQAIKSNIVWKEKEVPEARCEVEVELDDRGNIVARRVVLSQGHPDCCPTVLRALDRTERIPVDIDGRAPPRLVIAFRSKE